MGQTPDGETPSNEGICDQLMSATPGLYGLCVAYCEALDCESVDGTQLFECKDIPSGKILEKYNARKQPGDPDMPCIVVTGSCACWESHELDVLLDFVRPSLCQNDLDLTDLVNQSCTALNGKCVPGISLHSPAALVGTVAFPSGPFCLAFIGGEIRASGLTIEEAQACSAQLQTVGSEGEWDCF
jgi:hypothetical protein